MSWPYIRDNLNFYRIHLLALQVNIFIPLFGATILWASNGEFPVRFIDSLYVSISAATGTGLVTLDLSSLTIWQQVILVILELIGNQTFVCWVVVLVRRWYFLRNLKHIVAAELERNHTTPDAENDSPSLRHIRETLARLKEQKQIRETHPSHSPHAGTSRRSSQNRDAKPGLRVDMIRRLDIAPHLIDPMGSQAHRLTSDRPNESTGTDVLSRTASRRSLRSYAAPANPSAPVEREDDFGGFPGVEDVLVRVTRKFAPKLQRRLRRTLTVPRTETLIPRATGDTVPPIDGPVRRVPYLSFSATVKRNSTFHGLTAENIEELGGVEYRALCSLTWIIPLYYIGLLCISFVVTAPYMSLPRWRVNFHPPLQHKNINPIWFSAFQVIGAWANTGMSLVDQNMLPFQTAYPMVVFLVICVLAGNTCLVLHKSRLRLFIWLLTKLPGRSRTKESLHFLLDHPRRCTIYLFPSRQTWLLLGTMMILNCSNLFFYLILDIGNPATESLPFGVKFVDAVLDAAACRNAGYQPIPISSLMPAVQVLSVIMMYIAIFPIAMSVRATNVYEEKSLMIYENDDREDDELNDDAHWNTPSESRVAIWGRYLLRHARRQLSFDMWWLAGSLFLLCIIERANLTNASKQSYFNIFALLFELVSAYGTVGLSLGIPGVNYSLSGGMHTLSKLVVCAVMLRGRHRGLPVALDRAVLMPSEFLAIRSETQQPEERTSEKDAHHDGEGSRLPQSLHNPDELATRMRLRTRTISLIVEERRETWNNAKSPPWMPVADRVPEESRDSSVDGVSGSDRHA
ncbi:TrkH-domain-containing protein [Trametes punicea]|nr:TrkH-domain-containing protein [Trametes punicea]